MRRLAALLTALAVTVGVAVAHAGPVTDGRVYEVEAGDSWYRIADRLCPDPMTGQQRLDFAMLLAVRNGGDFSTTIHPGRLLNYRQADLASCGTPPTTTKPTTSTTTTTTTVPAGSFIAATLTASNTGVPAGQVLTTVGSVTYTGVDSGKVIEGVRFTGAVKILGASNLTIKNCVFAGKVSDSVYFQLTVRNSTNVRIEHCSFTGSGGATSADVDGTTIFRSYFTDFENAIRTHSNVTIIETLAEKPSLADSSAHIDGIEASGSPGELTSNLVVRDSRIDIGTKYATSPFYLSPYNRLTTVVSERNWFIGGSNAGYVELDTTDVSIVDTRFDGYLYNALMYRPQQPNVIKAWSGNTANGRALAKPT